MRLDRQTFSGIAPRLRHHPGVDVRARVEQQLHRRQHAVVGAIASARDPVAELDAGRRHQRRDAFLARQIDERAVLQQQLDERCSRRRARAQQRRAPLREDRVAAAILRHVTVRRTPLQLQIGIGAF
jgi:hypothetical protein